MTPRVHLSISNYLNLKRVSAVVPSPTGDWAAVAVSRLNKEKSKFISDIWRISLHGIEPPVKLTQGDYNDHSPSFRFDGTLGFLSDRPTAADQDKSEKLDQVWMLPTYGGEPYCLTNEALGVNAFQFARKGQRLIVMTKVLAHVSDEDQRKEFFARKKHGPSALHYTEMPVRFWDNWLSKAAPHVISYIDDGTNRLDLTPDANREHRNASWGISPDGNLLAITVNSEGKDRLPQHSILLFDLLKREEKTLTLPRNSTVDSSLCFSNDNRQLACLVHTRPQKRFGKPSLWLLSPETDDGRILAETWDAWPNPVGFSSGNESLIVTADEKGEVPVYQIDLKSGTPSRISAASSGGTHEGLSITDKGLIVGMRHSLLHPPEPCSMPIKSDVEPKMLASLSGFSKENGQMMASWEVFSTKVPDGGEVDTFLLTPKGEKKPRPTLLWIHGGPVGHFGDGWHWRWNPLLAVAEGYTVAMPNARGSTGYGQEFVEGVWNNQWGAACYRDLMAVFKALEDKPECDTKHAAAMGGSFGGYMANWIGVNTDRFQCLISHAGLYSLSAFHGVTDFPSWLTKEFGVSPYDDLENFDKYSPHRKIANWKSPTLVIHGEKDYRVPVGEALALFEALQHHKVESELLVFPDENHFILQPRNITVWYESIFRFLKKHIS